MTLIRDLREKTSAGVMECKQALLDAGGDLDKASDILKERGLAKAEKKMDRIASQGLVEAYVHAGGRIGAMIELNCESDFVARTDEFKALAHDLALQVAATNPQYISPEDIPQGTKVSPEEACLLAQPFIKDAGRKISDIMAEVSAKVGEKVVVGRFARFQISK
ncbi:MAG: translation elongation factor Ts [Chloroflexi bacterium]|nr:translation elongation factor Ts [Chloroflexota bacterium]